MHDNNISSACVRYENLNDYDETVKGFDVKLIKEQKKMVESEGCNEIKRNGEVG